MLARFGGWPFVLWPRISDERSPPEKRDMVGGKEPIGFCVSTGRKECFPFFRWWFVRHEGSNKQRLVVRGLFWEHCFVTNEAPFKFPELILVPFESQKRDLQFYIGPMASNKQGGCLFSELLPWNVFVNVPWNVFVNVWWIWDIALSPVSRHEAFRSWELGR